MTDPSRPDDDLPLARSEQPGGPPPMPRWVKLSLLVLALLVVVLVVGMLAGGGHGPSRHGAGPVAGTPAVGGAGAR